MSFHMMDMLRRRFLVAGCAFAILSAACSDAPEQRDQPIHDRTAERSERENHALAYDASHAQTVLFGGYSAGWNNQTWVLGAAGGGGGCGSADFNCDSDVGTDADIEAFFRVLAGGGC